VSTANSVQKFAVAGDLLISVTSAGVVSDQDWQEFTKALRTQRVTKYLAASLGKTEASSVQRREAAQILKAKGIRTAVLTDDTFTRGLVTAVGWLGANVSAFTWSDIDSGLKYLNVTESMAERARGTLSTLRAEVEAETPKR